MFSKLDPKLSSYIPLNLFRISIQFIEVSHAEIIK